MALAVLLRRQMHRLALVVALLFAAPAFAGSPSNPPAWVHGSVVVLPAQRLDVNAFIAWYQQSLRLPSQSQLEVLADSPSMTSGLRNVRLRHMYRGLWVVGDEILLSVRAGDVISAFARVIPDLNQSTAVSTTRLQAAAAAEREIGALLLRQYPSVRFSATTCELVLLRSGGTPSARPALKYNCKAATTEPLGSWSATLDPHTLRSTSIEDLTDHGTPVIAHGHTLHELQNVELPADYDATTMLYTLKTSTITTRDLQNTMDANQIIDVTSVIDFFWASPGSSAHWAAFRSLETFQARLGLDMLSVARARTSSREINILVRAGFENASFDSDAALMLVGSESGVDYTYLDIVAHEMGHGASNYSLPPSFLVDTHHSEYGALKESVSDILAKLVELDTLGANTWVLPSDPSFTFFRRNMIDPLLGDGPQPDVYQGVNWINPLDPFDDGGIHQNNSVYNLWFARMALGASGVNSDGTPFNVPAIGIDSASRIALKTYLEKTPLLGTYLSARDGSELVLRETCGDFSLERRSSINAWHSVGLHATGLTSFEHLKPMNEAIYVPAWPARLVWQAKVMELEDFWEVELAQDPNFLFDSQVYSVDDLTVELGLDVGYLELELTPDTTYYWRIRKLDHDPEMACWRPTRRFTTASMTPVPIYPQGIEVHPWWIDFSFQPVPGATHYDVQVFDPIPPPGDDKPRALFPPQRIPATLPLNPNNPQRARITVEKGKELIWRVRSVRVVAGETDQLSEWSAETPFMTADPQVVLTGPPDGNPEYPWPIALLWEPLRGATFDVQSQGFNAVYVTPHALGITDNFLVWYQNATSCWLSDQRGFTWWVEALGPPLGSELTPLGEDSREPARPSPERDVIIDGDPTLPQVTTSPPGTCVDFGQELFAIWNPVVGATDYYVTGSNPHVTQGLQASAVAGRIASINVDAKHEDVDGVSYAGMSWAVRPTKPTITAIYPDATDPNEIDYDWSCAYGGGDNWAVEAFEGSDCSGSLVYGESVHIPPDNPGGTAYGAMLYNFEPGTYSMRIKAEDISGCAASEWSECAVFFGPEPPPDPTTPVVQCGEIILWGNNAPASRVLYLGSVPTSGQVRLTYNHYCVPDQTVVTKPNGSGVINTGCVGTGEIVNGECFAEFLTTPWTQFEGASYLMINVLPNCLGTIDTGWEIYVECQL